MIQTRNKPLLSRVAESVYWMGRYTERAENVARFIGVNQNLTLDLPTEYGGGQWQPIVDTSGDRAAFLERYEVATQENVVRFLAFDLENPNSIRSCVQAARENARSVRDTISTEMWEQVNSLHLFVSDEARKPFDEVNPEFFVKVRMGCHLFQGITHATMSHNEPWHFIRLGQMLERADKTTRMLDVKYFILLPLVSDIGTPYDDIQWSAVLKSVSGFEMYRKRYGRIAPARVVEFLLLDSDFPRAVRYCADIADSSLHAITGARAGDYSCLSEQQLGRFRSELAFAQVAVVIKEGLHEFLDALELKMNKIDECVLGDFFAARPFAAGTAG